MVFYCRIAFLLQIRNEVAAELCIDTQHKGADDPFGVAECIKDRPGKTGEQVSYSFASVRVLLLVLTTFVLQCSSIE